MDVNLQIIKDINEFIFQAKTNPELRSLFLSSDKDFTRNRKMGFEKLVFFMLNFVKGSLNIELVNFYERIGEIENLVTKSNFCQERKKIKPLFFKSLTNLLLESFQTISGKNFKKWKGFQVLAMDGSSMKMISNEELREQFGTQDNQNKGDLAIGKMLLAYDVLNETTVKAELFTSERSEVAILQGWLLDGEIGKNKLMICDRGFTGFITAFLSIMKGCFFVVRARECFSKQVEKFMKSKKRDIIGEMECTTYEAANKLTQYGFKVSKGDKIKVRYVKVVLENGTTEVLITNLMDEKEYSSSCFKDLYKKRWCIETNFDALKNKFQLEVLSGQKPDFVLQDFEITIFLSNLVSILAKSCDEKLKKINESRFHDYKLNKNISIGILKNRLLQLFFESNPQENLDNLYDLFIKFIEPVRQNRSLPRNNKKINTKGKYRTISNYKRVI